MWFRSLLVAPVLLLLLGCFQTVHEIHAVDTREGVAFRSGTTASSSRTTAA